MKKLKEIFSIETYCEIYRYIASDYTRYYDKPDLFKILLHIVPGVNHRIAFLFWLRLASRPNIFYGIARVIHRIYEHKYALRISPKTQIGYGLFIGPGFSIFVNRTVEIGNNCNLSQLTTIGSNSFRGATIGDNVYIGPSVCIVENVHIGNNASIGAGAVVTKDVPENATVAGVPAKVLNYDNPGRFIARRWGDKHLL